MEARLAPRAGSSLKHPPRAHHGHAPHEHDEPPLPHTERPRHRPGEVFPTARPRERAVLAAVLIKGDPRADVEDPLAELEALASTAEVDCLPERVIQKRDHPDGATCLGKGAVERLAEQVREQKVDVVIFDHDLAPRQRRNLEETLKTRVIDRTELILDIFARHARTPQAKLQVELAQLEYELPRLRKLWTHLDTGVGLRAAGEKQLEVDKRLVRIRIQELQRELAQVRGRKERELSQRGETFAVAIVGYTNAGKSTLMNRLTGAGVYVADKLFATLDTRTRAWPVGPRRTVLLSDTVGFIRQLPHHLVESFHATLEEVLTADLLLHVVDASDPEALDHVRAVREVLTALGAQDKPELVVLNKVDQAGRELLPYLERRLVNTLRVSAHTGEGVEGLTERVNELARKSERRYRILADVREGAALAVIEGRAEILSRDLAEERLVFEVRCWPQVIAHARSRARDPERFQVEELPEPAPTAEEAGEAGEEASPTVQAS